MKYKNFTIDCFFYDTTNFLVETYFKINLNKKWNNLKANADAHVHFILDDETEELIQLYMVCDYIFFIAHNCRFIPGIHVSKSFQIEISNITQESVVFSMSLRSRLPNKYFDIKFSNDYYYCLLPRFSKRFGEINNFKIMKKYFI